MQRVTQGRLRGGGYARPNIQELEPLEDHNFLLQLSPQPFNFGYMCFGLYRYSLT